MADKVRINPMALPQKQLRPVVKAIGYGIQYWQEGIANGRIDVVELYAYLLAAHENAPLDKYDGLTPEAILEMVEVTDDADPQTPSKP